MLVESRFEQATDESEYSLETRRVTESTVKASTKPREEERNGGVLV